MDGQIRPRKPAPPVRPKPPSDKPLKTFSHFATVEEWQEHRRQVEEAQRNGSPF